MASPKEANARPACELALPEKADGGGDAGGLFGVDDTSATAAAMGAAAGAAWDSEGGEDEDEAGEAAAGEEDAMETDGA